MTKHILRNGRRMQFRRPSRQGIQRTTALTVLGVVSSAWTVSLVGVGSAASLSAASTDPATQSDDGLVAARTIEDPANYSRPESSGLGLPDEPGDRIVQAASTNGIPSAALSAYQRAATVINAADKSCHIPWELVAAIGRVESDHGRYGDNTLGRDGISRPGIYGIPLDGSNATMEILDTDAGQYDNDLKHDRAVGPMQFIPQTWSVVGVDADGDGKRNPQDIDDAALATAVYLCSGDTNLLSDAGKNSAIYRYNHSNKYVNLVLRIMSAYTDGEYTSVPNATTSAAYIPAVSDATRPTRDRLDGPDVVTTDAGSNAADPGGATQDSDRASTGTPSTETQPTPSERPKAPAKDLEKTVKELPETLKKTVKDPVGTVTKTLTTAQATAQCLASGISKLDLFRLTGCITKLLQP